MAYCRSPKSFKVVRRKRTWTIALSNCDFASADLRGVHKPEDLPRLNVVVDRLENHRDGPRHSRRQVRDAGRIEGDFAVCRYGIRHGPFVHHVDVDAGLVGRFRRRQLHETLLQIVSAVVLRPVHQSPRPVCRVS